MLAWVALLLLNSLEPQLTLVMRPVVSPFLQDHGFQHIVQKVTRQHTLFFLLLDELFPGHLSLLITIQFILVPHSENDAVLLFLIPELARSNESDQMLNGLFVLVALFSVLILAVVRQQGVMLSGQHHCFSTIQMTNEEGIQEEQLNIMTKVTDLFLADNFKTCWLS